MSIRLIPNMRIMPDDIRADKTLIREIIVSVSPNISSQVAWNCFTYFRQYKIILYFLNAQRNIYRHSRYKTRERKERRNILLEIVGKLWSRCRINVFPALTDSISLRSRFVISETADWNTRGRDSIDEEAWERASRKSTRTLTDGLV